MKVLCVCVSYKSSAPLSLSAPLTRQWRVYFWPTTRFTFPLSLVNHQNIVNRIMRNMFMIPFIYTVIPHWHVLPEHFCKVPSVFSCYFNTHWCGIIIYFKWLSVRCCFMFVMQQWCRKTQFWCWSVPSSQTWAVWVCCQVSSWDLSRRWWFKKKRFLLIPHRKLCLRLLGLNVTMWHPRSFHC